MWTREQLKNRCKDVMKENYWMMFLVAIIASLLGATNEFHVSIRSSAIIQFFTSFFFFPFTHLDFYANDYLAYTLMISVVLLFIGIILLIVFVIKAFLCNPIQCGICHFFIENRTSKPSVSLVFQYFSNNYMNIVKIMFLKDIKVALWSILLIIPGIIKYYEYRMIPYILANHPDISTKEAFAQSKAMTASEKFNIFVLDLSFIGWRILGSFIIIGNLFVNPYYEGVQAELYEIVKQKVSY